MCQALASPTTRSPVRVRHRSPLHKAASAAAALCRRLLFLWVTPAVRRGWRVPLSQDDASACAGWATRSTEALLAWYDEQDASLSYRRRLWLLVRWRLVGSGVMYAIFVASQLAQPLLLQRIVRAVAAHEQGEGMWLAVLVGLNGVAGSLAKEQQLFATFCLGAELRSLSVALVYRTALSLRAASAPPSTANLLSNDAQKLLDALPLIHLLWACPLMILVAALLLVDLAGVAALAGIGLLLTMIPLNLLLVRRLKAARAPPTRTFKLTDKLLID